MRPPGRGFGNSGSGANGGKVGFDEFTHRRLVASRTSPRGFTDDMVGSVLLATRVQLGIDQAISGAAAEIRDSSPNSPVWRAECSPTPRSAVERRVDDLPARSTCEGACPHAPDDGCHYQVPEPGLILWRSDGCARPRLSAWSSVTSARTSKPAAGRAASASSSPPIGPAVRAVLNGPPQGSVPVDERPIEAAFDTGPRPR
ncbi:hypothetical protein [Streptomyces sp. SAI-127]|uniref:hypothetical protein n=1 Tax=Streptomyces sp. SAI-127 TaxID=2940543 RepID=UPI0024767025|nr:hypothetical protein [Streptomyces sp. SAI-127]MDH6489389.1 hypothetical protein [Streptomyces sp. SAI-127]